MLSVISSYVERSKDFKHNVANASNKLKIRKRDEMVQDYWEAYLLSGYRSDYSVTDVIISLFRRTNETLNFWTHIIPSLFFLYQFYHFSSVYDFTRDSYMFPFHCYLLSIVLYPGVSALAHAFSCMSPAANHICFLLDYSTLSFYSWGAGLLYAAYCMPINFYGSWYSYIFLPVGSLLAVLATLCACYSRFAGSMALRKVLRLCAFTIPFIWDSIPLLSRLMTFDPNEDVACAASSAYHVTQFVSVSTASFFYATHVPEVFFPGKFDFIGHSHSLMHIFATFATYQQMNGALVDLELRRDLFTERNFVVNPLWSNAVTPFLMIINFILILVFAILLAGNPEKMKPFCRSDWIKTNSSNGVSEGDHSKKDE